jgi:hypothetical protein
MQRRDFIKFCAASGAAAGAPALAADATPSYYGRTRLVDGGGKALKAASLPVDRNLIFPLPVRDHALLPA